LTIKSGHRISFFRNGIVALEKKAPTLLIDFAGLKIYSAKQITSALKEQWPALSAERIEFPGTERLARSLDLSANRVKLAERIKPLIKDAKYIGFPAVLGIYRSCETIKELEELLGLPIFEIPPLSPFPASGSRRPSPWDWKSGTPPGHTDSSYSE
jgi:glycerol-3-phosphate dehydrogenase subunit B